MFILLVFGRRYLTSIEVELYGGLSSRIVILYLLLLSRVIRGASILDYLNYIPIYGYITPFERLITTIPYESLPVNIDFYTIFISTWLILTIFILYLLYLGARYQVKALKICYSTAIILNAFTILPITIFMPGYMSILGMIQVIFWIFTLQRLIDISKKSGNKKINIQ